MEYRGVPDGHNLLLDNRKIANAPTGRENERQSQKKSIFDMFHNLKSIYCFMVHSWTPIPGFDQYVACSETGEIKSLYTGRILKPSVTSRYAKITLYKDGVAYTCNVHRLICLTFPEICGEWFEGAVVNHKDENVLNNSATNLEFCTQKYNINYGDRNRKVSEKMAGRKLSPETITKLKLRVPKKEGERPKEKRVMQFDINGNYIQTFVSASAAIRALGKDAHISDVCKGKLKTTAGYIWKYE